MTASRRRRVLFVCTHNSARSQMAEGIGKQFADRNVEVFSAGSEPTVVDPRAVTVMKEIGIDITGQRSKHIREFAGWELDYIVMLCDRAAESCPTFPGVAKRIHFSFPDPAAARGRAEEVLNQFRTVRDLIREKLTPFLESLATGESN